MDNKEEQLIKEAKERGFLTEGNEFYSCFNDKNELRIIKSYYSKSEINLYLDLGGYLRYLDGLDNKHNGMLCSNPAIYKDGVWAEIKNIYLTLEQQLEKAKAEVKRLKDEIEEGKIKIGDLVCYTSIHNKKVMLFGYCEDIKDNNIYIGGLNYEDKQCKKITDQELINKLNNLIK